MWGLRWRGISLENHLDNQLITSYLRIFLANIGALLVYGFEGH